jgi:hypothetical protein
LEATFDELIARLGETSNLMQIPGEETSGITQLGGVIHKEQQNKRQIVVGVTFEK